MATATSVAIEGAVSAAGAVRANYGPVHATDTMLHRHGPIRQVCIEYNPRVQVAGIVSMLQAELLRKDVGSRVYEQGDAAVDCGFWLRYSAFVTWDGGSGGDAPRTSLQDLTVSVFTGSGELVASSSYHADSGPASGRRYGVQTKLAVVMDAVFSRPED